MNSYMKIIFLLAINACVLNAKSSPLLLISMDGFQAAKLHQFMNENPSSNFTQFYNKSLGADYMNPSEPSITFPNHLTLVTGLYPESHGIINNVIYDPNFDQKVKLAQSQDLKWWNLSEPIWYTAKKQGLKTGSSFWISNNVWPRQPDVFLSYNPNYDSFDRVDEIINWYRKFDLDFLCVYFDEPDSTGHKYGPDSKEYMEKIGYMDSVFGYLLKRLDDIGLFQKLNIILVSDHGMANFAPNHYVFIKDYVNTDLIDMDKSVFHVVSNIFPKSDDKLNELYEQMKKLPNMKSYKKSEIPKELNYSKSDRIGDIVSFSNEGYKLMDQVSTDNNRGAHGYASNLTSMRAIFMAHGPNIKPGRIEGFRNVNVYPLMCSLMNINCNPNNGSIAIFEPYIEKNSTNYKNESKLYVILAFLMAKLKIF
ncbi:alkaline phosphatase family [Brachionus plicatilis]|uniref:Alkaline phosphatase family n=1 Tax=Brachionus plicatilis TaxID=10195 RepID=A0A3M7QE88_BRAPC|nr:alkaline phosphatase family [Brachionus plicatilis]